MAKPAGRGGGGQTTEGARVARERAARRRAAKERAAREQALAGHRGAAAEETTGEPLVVEIPQSDLMNEVSVLATLIAAGLARHHPEARRLFRDEGVQVNGEPVLSDKDAAGLSFAEIMAAVTGADEPGRS